MKQKVVALDDETKSMNWRDAIIEDENASGPWRAENNALADAATIMSLFFSEDWVFICADLLASEFSSPWPRVMKKEIIDGREVSKPAEAHPLQTLLDDPTLYGGSQQFWYRAGVFDCLLGNCFMWYMKANKKLLIIPSHEVTIGFDDKTKLPNRYIWNVGDTNAGIKSGVAFPREEVLHVQRANPASMWWGLSPFVPGRRSVLFNRYSGEFLNSFFEKGATPQMIVETEIGNNAEAIKTLAKSFELVNGGRKNQRRPLVLPKGAKVTQVNMTLADTQLQQFINQNREVILNLLRIPKHALGLQTAGSLGSEEHKTALRFMWGSTVKPMLKRFSTALTKFFRAQGMLDATHYIDFDTSEIEIANEDMGRKADLALKLACTHTINEIRRVLWDTDPLDGGDIIPGVLPPPTPTALPFQLAQPEENQVEKAVAELPVTPRAKMPGFEKFLERAEVKAMDETLVEQERTTGSKLQEFVTDFLIDQLRTALSVAKTELKQKARIDKEELAAEIMGELLKDQERFTKSYTGTLSNTLDVGYGSQVALVFNQKNREQLEALRAETSKGRRSILARLAEQRFAEITKTTSSRIVEEIAKGIEENESITTIASRIAENFPQIVRSRAQTIARTETLTAVSIGQQSALKNAARVMPDAQKVWITAKDDRVRDDHADTHGDVVGLNEKFTVGNEKLSVPREPGASAGTTINCRCTVAIIAKEDLGEIDV